MKRIASERPALDTRDLEVVLALAAAGSTAGAVKTLHLTQSAVSRALAVAEDKLGVRLFERTARGLTPTKAGDRLVEGAGPVLAQLCELERSVRAPESAPVRVRIVCECYTAYRWLPSALADLSKKLPHLDVKLAVEHTREPTEALAAGEVDVALLTTGSIAGFGVGLVERSLFSDEVIFAVSTSHPLANKKSLTREDLLTHKLVTSNAPEAENRWFARAVFGRARPKLDVLRFPLTEAVVDSARAGVGIAVLSEWIAKSYLDDPRLLAKRLSTGPLRRPWRIAYRREHAAAANALAVALRGTAPRVYSAAAAE